MSAVNKATLRIILLGLAGGGLCGAAVGLGYATPLAGVAGAVILGVAVGVLVARAKRKASAE